MRLTHRAEVGSRRLGTTEEIGSLCTPKEIGSLCTPIEIGWLWRGGGQVWLEFCTAEEIWLGCCWLCTAEEVLVGRPWCLVCGERVCAAEEVGRLRCLVRVGRLCTGKEVWLRTGSVWRHVEKVRFERVWLGS